MSDFRQRIEKLSPKRLALLALELQSKLEEKERERTEPIAIIGIGCRMPGSGSGSQAFWKFLEESRDAVTETPVERWDVSEYYDPNPDAPGRMSTKLGSYLSDVDLFDAPFFSIARREAISMDPQQRVLLEVCWEALENAGHSPRKLSGTATGVFVGICSTDYHGLLLARGEEAIDAYVASGVAPSIAAGRISYTLGLQGPSMAVDTACSASLVAVHLACQSLRTRESRMALAGGVNIMLSPETTIALSKAHMMAPDGRCKAFDSRADGFVRGEGCGIVVLKRLSDALADSDNILAVIRASAVNQDGRSSGITAPNGAAQESLIRQALANGGVKPEEISFVEAHGTGTSLGDPIEAHALAAVLGPGRSAENPLVVGSVKTNVGHLESAAGVTGLIKLALSLQHEKIPANLHFQKMNPHIDWNGVPVEIPVAARPWARGEKKRLAALSSFGFSGTNAHVIVEEAPPSKERKKEFHRPMHILALSGRNETALRELSARYEEELGKTSAEPGDICYTANAGRAHFEQRMFVVGATVEEIRGKLQERKTGTEAQERGGVRPVFLFSGQGAQYAGMGKQ
ncbi:MAG TPA: beta-ketoacyl synthase N-terminal-like domain-containing protein, partial [Candidatus Acidoferrales bacterium]|nr:beta-ketoacyl synthase N-terminal-like domain-containing protein [Candidatus Acidoferrales bacterium]